MPESIAMNAMDQLVPKDLEDRLLLNQSRLKTFASYELEIKNYVEAKHGGKVKITADFTKDDGGVQPMDVSAFGCGSFRPEHQGHRSLRQRRQRWQRRWQK